MSSLFERLSEAKSLPSPPGVALEIMRLNEDEEVSIAQLCEVVARDPALATKLMRTANSSSMGRPGLVADLDDAVMVLGTRTVNLLALSFSLASVEGGRSQAFDYSRFWTFSAVTTVAARRIAGSQLPAQRDAAFLAGLLCDFAQLILAESAATEYAPVLACMEVDDRPLHFIERELLGEDHASLGAEVLAAWGIPPVICESIRGHHMPEDPALPEDARGLARVLHLASTCAALYVEGHLDRADELVALAHQYFGMDSDDCQELIDGICEEAPEFLDVLDLQIIDSGAVEAIRSRASELLIRESLSLEQRVQSISTTLEQLSHRNTELEKKLTIDPLTGLHNRLFLEQMLDFEVQRIAKEGGSIGLLIMDVDHFKGINDGYGHLVGDKVLREVANLIQSRVAGDQRAIRCGGDEFIVVCPSATTGSLLERAQMIRRAIEHAVVRWQGQEVQVSLSIGGFVVDESVTKEPTTTLLAGADAELYRAKEKGRNRVFVSAQLAESG